MLFIKKIMMNKINLVIFLFLFLTINIIAQDNDINITSSKEYYDLNNFNSLKYHKFKEYIFNSDINLKIKSYIHYDIPNNYQNIKFETGIKFSYFKEVQKYKFERKKENLLRRSEILFFGSLTFSAFGSWFFLSVFNALIYGEPFGKIRQEQFVPLFAGSSLISISIVLTDLFITIRPKLKNVEIY